MDLKTLRAAAEQGNSDAQLQMGIASMTGAPGLAQDAAVGRAWLSRAAEGGNATAARFLGLLYLRGMDVTPEPERARALLQQASDAGDAEAGFWLASYLGGGRHEAQDRALARHTLERAAAAGSARAMTHLAYLLLGHGDGAPAPMQAASWLHRAATAGDGGALLALAEWSEHGFLLPANRGRARWLAEQAASRGWEVAAEYAQGLEAQPVPGIPAMEVFSDRHDGVLPQPRLEVFSWSPRVLLFHDLFSVFECAEVAMAAREHLTASFIVNQDGEMGTNDVRTSHEVRLRPALRTVVIDVLERRLADWSQVPVEHGELPLVLRYERSQSFEQHFDYFIPERFAMGTGPLEFGGQRVATQLVYLNEAFSGGETRFDNAGLTVQPKRGMCMMFHNVGPDHNVDPLTRHTGVAVSSGVKWLLSRWIRELPVDKSSADHPRDRYAAP